MVLPKIQKTTLVDQIVKIIINKIDNKELNVGDFLPSEIDMSKQFGVSRATIRESISYLIGMSIIRKNVNGLIVSQSPSSAIFNDLSSFIDIGMETHSLYEARIFFDIGFAYLAALKADEDDISELEELNSRIINNIDNPKLYWEKDLEFHYKLASIANNEFLFSSYKYIMKLFTESLGAKDENTLFKQTLVVENTPHNHNRLINSLKNGEPIDAIKIRIESLDVAMEDMISRKIKQAIPKDSNDY